MRKPALFAVFLLLVALSAGCQSTDTYWSMPASRWAYGEAEIHKLLTTSGPSVSSAEGAAVLLAAYGVILLTPVAIDTALLPFTLGHDIWLLVHRRRRDRG